MPDSEHGQSVSRGQELLRGGYLPNLEIGEPQRVSLRSRPGGTAYELDVCVRGDKVGTLKVELHSYGNGQISVHSELEKAA